MPLETPQNRTCGIVAIATVIVIIFAVGWSAGTVPFRAIMDTNCVEEMRLKTAVGCMKLGVCQRWAVMTMLRHKEPPESAKNFIWQPKTMTRLWAKDAEVEQDE